MTWSDIVGQWKESKPKPRPKTLSDLTGPSIQESNRQGPGHWTIPANRRAFLLSFANKQQFDPFVSKNWYRVSNSELVLGGGKGMLSYFKSFREAIMESLPELEWDEDQFYLSKGRKIPHKMGYWRNPANCRKLLEDFAKQQNFDHLDAEAWKKVKVGQLADFGADSLFAHHHKTISSLLAHAYPEVFTNSSIPVPEKKPKLTMADIRQFFDAFATKYQFDPLSAENWYSTTYKEIRQEERGRTVLGRFRDCHREAIAAAYPEANIDVEKFHGYIASKKKQVGHWKDPSNCRRFFDHLASAMGFDPLVPNNWSKVTPSEMSSTKWTSILSHFEGSSTKALAFAYPGLSFQT